MNRADGHTNSQYTEVLIETILLNFIFLNSMLPSGV